jgi:hypothetical protein
MEYELNCYDPQTMHVALYTLRLTNLVHLVLFMTASIWRWAYGNSAMALPEGSHTGYLDSLACWYILRYKDATLRPTTLLKQLHAEAEQSHSFCSSASSLRDIAKSCWALTASSGSSWPTFATAPHSCCFGRKGSGVHIIAARKSGNERKCDMGGNLASKGSQ